MTKAAMPNFQRRIRLSLTVSCLILWLAASPAAAAGRAACAAGKPNLAGPDMGGTVGGQADSRAPASDVIVTVPQGCPGDVMTLEIRVPPLEIRDRHVGRRLFQELLLAGYGSTSEIGKPSLPVKGFLLAVPEGGTVDVEILRADTLHASGVTVCPVPAPLVDMDAFDTGEEYVADPQAYSADTFYPGRVAEIGSYGYLRGVRVVELRVFPVQYDPPKGDLVIHRTIVLRLHSSAGRFPFASEPAGAPGAASVCDPYESVYRGLIVNYEPGYATCCPGLNHAGRADEVLPYLAGEAYKIGVSKDGIYGISRADLAGAGADFDGVDPRSIRLFNMGAEVPIVVWGEDDGTFDPPDYIEFYGLKNRSQYSLTNVYWLTWGGAAGARMEAENCRPGDSLSVPISFVETLRFEEDNRYYSNVYLGEGQDHWFWEQLTAPCAGSYPVEVEGVSSTAADAAVTICLLGKTSYPHHAQVRLNGSLIADLDWDGRVNLETRTGFPQAYLCPGLNEVSIDCPGSAMDQMFLNWFEIEYARTYEAFEDHLCFSDTSEAPTQLEVGGFSADAIELFRITDPADPVRLTDHVTRAEGSGYTLAFESRSSGQAYVALTSDRRRKPLWIDRHEVSDLRSSANHADYVIIAHDDFRDAVLPLAALRGSEGLDVKVVKVSDIYDEFSYGLFDPEAIRDFLACAYYTWQAPSPCYVLLVGDASYDYKGNIPGGNKNFVPTHLFVSQSEFLETCSDDWFGYLAGDDLYPDVLIGRLSAQTEAEVETMVNKIIDYEVNLPAGTWRQKVVLVADDPDQGGDFETVCDGFADDYIVPAGLSVARVYVTECMAGCRDNLINRIRDGCAVCNFVGHGSLDLWTGDQVFESADVKDLNNKYRQPLVVAFTCLNGFFHHATDDYCLAEAFTRADDEGAIACWCQSGLDYTFESEVIGRFLYQGLLVDGDYRLGSAVATAKTRYLATSPFFWDQAEMLILFGDPALEVGFAGRPDVLPGSITFDPPHPTAGGRDTINVSIYNAGREDASGIVVRFTEGHPDSAGARVIQDLTIPLIKAGGQAGAQAVWGPLPDPGTYWVGAIVDPDSQLVESCEWNNRSSGSIVILPAGGIGDTTAPSIRLLVDDKVVGRDIHDFDYVRADPVVEAIITDSESGIDTRDVGVSLNGTPVAGFSLDPDTTGAHSVHLICPLDSLPDGVYDLRVTAADCCSVPNHAGAGASFVVESHLEVVGQRASPNPSREGARLSFRLSQEAAEITVEIYSVRGRQINVLRTTGGSLNANAVYWDGRDGKGMLVEPGLYFYRIRARRGRESVEVGGKVLILR